MDYSIAAIIPNEIIAGTVKKVFQQRGFDYPVYSCSANNGFSEEINKIIKVLKQNNTQIIISMGITFNHIRENTNIMVLELQYTGLEFIDTLTKGLKYSEKVAVVGSKNLVTLMRKTVESLDKPVELVQFNFEEAIEQQVKRVIDRGYDVIIGGTLPAATAQKYGKIGIMPEVDENMVEVMLDNALYIKGLLNEVAEKLETLNTILDCISEGIIGTDRSRKITFVNSVAEKIIGVEKEKLYEKPINKVLRENKVVNAFNDASGKNKISNGLHKVIINTVPVEVGNDVTGFITTVKEIAEIQQLEQKIRKKTLAKGHIAKNTFNDIIGESAIMKKIKNTAKEYALFDSTILISGETGTGKEIFAQSIHNSSPRKEQAFVAVNCAALPENLLESELFGYVKGAFTGAKQEGKTGFFEMAHNGTIFLDEISEIPLNMQARLLRVLQEKEIVKIGDDKIIPINVRVLCASNKNLLDLVEKGEFREDLYYRLCVLEVKLPPLRERREDIKAIAENMIEKNNIRLNKNIIGMTPELAKRLSRMNWNGNIRQLGNIMERMMVMCKSDKLGVSLLDEIFYDPKECGVYGITDNTLENMEMQRIYEVLEQTGGDKKEAVKILGISMSTLWRKLKATEYNKSINYSAFSQSEEHDLKTLDDMEMQRIYEVLRETNGNRRKAAEILGIHVSTLWRKLKSAENNTIGQ